MTEKLRLMCVLAHPDDESLGTGGILARYAAEDIETYLVTATRGEYGWSDDQGEYPGPEALGQIREAELQAAAQALGVKELTFLDYIDGKLDQADPAEAIGKIVTHLRRIRPQVVVTFDPFGAYGHPDHIAICQFTTAAIMAAASPDRNETTEFPSHQVQKLYYMVTSRELVAEYQTIFGELKMEIDGVERQMTAWDDWSITARIDTSNYWQSVWNAVLCHQTQIPASLRDLSQERHKTLWGDQSYYRAFSLVNSGRKVENDLFEGLRNHKASG